MEKFKEFCHDNFSHAVPFQQRILNIILVTTFLLGTIAFIVSVSLKMPFKGNLVVLCCLFLAVLCFIISSVLKKPLAAAIILCLSFNAFLLPFMYFYQGGIESGVPIWFSLGLILPWLLIPGKSCFIVFGISVLSASFTFFLAYYYPEKVVQIGSDYLILSDTFMAVALVSIIVGIMFRFETKEHLSQRRILKKQEEDLHITMNNLVKADKAKTAFLSTLTHDIRIPLNAVIGFTSMAKKNFDDREKVRNCLEKILASSDYLLSLVNNVLDISKIEAGRMKLDCKSCDIFEIIQDVQEIFDEDAKSKNIDFSVDTSTVADSCIYADPVRIKQVVINLLSNAIKFTKPYGSVSLTVEQKKKTENQVFYQICVKDTGIGMSENFQKYVFESYERESNEFVSETPGSGLGLAITKSLVQLMNGNISVQSKIGEGSTFTVDFSFPLVQRLNSDELPEDVFYCFDGKRILLAEDNRLNQEIAVAILREYGMFADVAENGLDAFNMVKDSEPGYYNAVLMDIQMPIMNGYEATKAIRGLKDSKLASIPIIAMTADVFDNEDFAIQCGMNDYVSKPIEIPKLMQALNNVLS